MWVCRKKPIGYAGGWLDFGRAPALQALVEVLPSLVPWLSRAWSRLAHTLWAEVAPVLLSVVPVEPVLALLEAVAPPLPW